MTEKAHLDARTGACEWVDKDVVMRDIPATKELVVEIWASDASGWGGVDWEVINGVGLF